MIAGDIIDNRTIRDVFGVANTAGIRVNNRRSLIVLISNNTDPTYRNEWREGELHFVGMGSVGPQKLGRQNRTLADSAKRGYTLHLFVVFEKSRYVYAGEVELAADPYMSDQDDARADKRFVWIFPLRRKDNASTDAIMASDAQPPDHLPYGSYALIGSDLSDDQVKLVNDTLDRLKQAGVTVLDQRDVDHKRYQKALAAWHEAVLDRVRSTVRELVVKRKRTAKAHNRDFGLVDDELRINSASTEQELREALKFLDRDDSAAMNEVFEEARRCVAMPDPPRSLQNLTETESMRAADLKRGGVERIDPARFLDFT